MEIYKEIPKKNKPTCVAIGKFDGVHLGHLSLLEELVLIAELNETESLCFSFEPFPEEFFSGKSVKRINTKGEIISAMDEIGVDSLVRVNFDAAFSEITPESFVKDILVGKLRAKTVVCGEDVSFGKEGRGNFELLNKLKDKYGFEVEVIDKVMYKDECISSKRIGTAITEGRFEDVSEMLGYDYYLYGAIVKGEGLGRTFEVPTVNINPPAERIIPKNGVYFTVVETDEKEYYAITNVGVRPTVSDGSAVNIESHLLNCEKGVDLYGEHIKVYFLSFLRDETVFSSKEELFAQIKKDIDDAKAFFGMEKEIK